MKTLGEICSLASEECSAIRSMQLEDPPPEEDVWVFNRSDLDDFTKKLLESAEKIGPATYKALDQFRKQRKMILAVIKLVREWDHMKPVLDILERCTCDADGGEEHKDECLKWVWAHLDR